jgi:hypothetical protein
MYEVVHFIFWLATGRRASAAGSTVVAVRCENCRNKYYYELNRAVRTFESGRERARKAAEHQLRQRLDNDIDPIPCPHCGWFQKEMISLLRSWRLRWMKVLGIIGLAASVPISFVGIALSDQRNQQRINIEPRVKYLIWGLYIFTLLGAALLFLVRNVRNSKYDPNDPETEQERIEFGRRFAITKDEADKILNRE